MASTAGRDFVAPIQGVVAPIQLSASEPRHFAFGFLLFFRCGCGRGGGCGSCCERRGERGGGVRGGRGGEHGGREGMSRGALRLWVAMGCGLEVCPEP